MTGRLPDALAKINALVRKTDSDANLLPSLCETAAEFFNASVIFADAFGKTLCQFVPDGTQLSEQIVLPVVTAADQLGSISIGKEKELSSDEAALAGVVTALVSLILRHAGETERAETSRQTMSAKAALGTLSYSELTAVLKMFSALGENGQIIAGKIADDAGISRSVIISALRKLESAGVIEARSLGAKGTHIQVLNKRLYAELKNYNK